MKRKPRILFAGGGSGGHLFPGIAVAEEITGTFGWDAVFLSTSKRIETTVFGGYRFPVRCVDAPKFTKNPLGLPGFAWKMARALNRSEKMLDELKPSAVVGLGSYASVGPVLAAARRGTPVFLLEQNAVPGKANRLLSTWAAGVFAQWECSRKYFRRPRRVVVAGNPLRTRIRTVSRYYARFALGLSPWQRTLLVLGGSQGARGLNRRIPECVKQTKKDISTLQILHLCGDKNNKEVSASYGEGGCRAVVMPFVSEMELAYAAADLVVARAGGTTIAELAALGKPAVLVPFPSATDDHQRANAREYANLGAAEIIEETDLSPENADIMIFGLLFDARRLEALGRAAALAAYPDAGARVARTIIEKASGRSIHIQSDRKECANG
jgi:UDP-N-acetylglucosamine--N-acetylmuramyl-(pentapeptide) pyrophosphoryl-undecaprenol N-acetylglucosamine transferase